MPYKVVGNKVMHFKNGKWSVKQNCSSPENASAAVRLLYGIESGGIKPSQVGHKKKKGGK